jgi:secreted Zn-dependent insulinase-like peptidase
VIILRPDDNHDCVAQVLKEKHWASESLLHEASTLTANELRAFIPQFLGRLHVDGLLHGNANVSDASALAALVGRLLRENHVIPLPSAEYPRNATVRLPVGKNLLIAVPGRDVSDRNSALEAYWQVGLSHVA